MTLAAKTHMYICNIMFSPNTLAEVDDDFILIKGELKTEVEKMKSQPGKDIAVFGGCELVSSLLNIELIYELSLAICPTVLGKGCLFFPSVTKRSDWSVKELKTYNSGLISLTYQRK